MCWCRLSFNINIIGHLVCYDCPNSFFFCLAGLKAVTHTLTLSLQLDGQKRRHKKKYEFWRFHRKPHTTETLLLLHLTCFKNNNVSFFLDDSLMHRCAHC